MRRMSIAAHAGLVGCLGLALAWWPLAQAAPQGQSRQPATKATSPEKAESGDASRGKKVFAAKCELCHFSDSTAKKIGPGLKGLSKRGTFADGKKVDDPSLREWIENGSGKMPAFKAVLSAEQVRDLIAYLKIL